MAADFFSLPMISATLSTAVALSAAVLAFGLRSSPSRLPRVGVCAGVVVHAWAWALMQRAPAANDALACARVLCSSAFLLASAVYQFVVTALDAPRHHRIAVALSWAVAAQLSVVALITGYGPNGLRRW